MTTDPLAFKINSPDCERASVLAFQADQKAEAEDFESAIRLIEQAIQLDSIAALNSFNATRASFYEAIGQDGPQRAIDMYNHAIHLIRSGRLRDCVVAYKEAAALDSLFLWPLNNLAWTLSTSKDEATCDGAEAVRLAHEACEKSHWNCWSFISTLAAAYAAAGDFERAVGWQQASLEIVPPSHRLDAEIMLRHFHSRQRYIDEGCPKAAGGSDQREEVSPQRLLQPENVSRHSLRQLLQDAFLEAEFDADGELVVVDRMRMLVTPSDDGTFVTFIMFMKPRNCISLKTCLKLVNKINCSMRLVRAAYHKVGAFAFDYTIPIAGGISKKTLMFAIRFFQGAVFAAIEQCDREGVLKATGAESEFFDDDAN